MYLRTSTFVLAVTSALSAQNDFNYDKLTSGRLGSALDIQVTAAPPSSIGLFLVSGDAGPIPLIYLDGVDTRSLQVGIDLLGLMAIQLMSPTGTALTSVPLPPSSPSLNGIVFHWQVATLATAGPTFIGQISNDVVTQTGMPDTGVLTTAVLGTARALATSFFDRDNNAGQGDVVIAGGGTGSLTAATGLATTEVWDFRHMQRVAGATMTTARALHLAVPLTDNRVLIIGGVNAAGVTLSSCEIYDPTTNSYAATGSMATPRVLHAACRLADGRVMVAGGTSTVQPDVVAALTNTQNTVEIWNPATNLWSGASPIGGARLAPALTLLSTNQVMVSGGIQVTVFLGIPIAANSVTTVQRWNPGTGSWTAGGSMSQARAGHHYNQVTLLDGRVLMTGGVNMPSLAGASTAAPINGAEAYNPTTNTWAAYNMPNARALHSATRLADGRVVVCGGAQGTLLASVPIDLVDVFTPATNSWSIAPVLTAPRASHVAQLLPDGTLILFGGQGSSMTLDTIETLRF
ncbi:MAG TPA: kelch repeat-containing protein [Planctomycetota bacterium]|nr:kelch repeat-containing protein [Planctomycetota bacterium]